MCLAIPGKIKSLNEEDFSLATVEVADVRRTVNVELLRDGGLEVGDWVLIHVGFAMSKISAEEAEEQMQLLHTLGETQEALDEVQGYGSEEDPSEADPFGDDPFDPLDGKNPFADDSAAENGAGAARGDPSGEKAPPKEAREEKPLEEP